MSKQNNISFNKFIDELEYSSNFDFNGLKNIFNVYGIIVKDSVLKGDILGLTSFNSEIHFNMSKIKNLLENKIISHADIFFLILHELCHFIRIKKYGKDYHIKNIITDNFDEFCEFLLYEEMVCDKFSTIYFYKFNKLKYSGKFIRDFSSYLLKEYYTNGLNKTYKKASEYNFDFEKMVDEYFVVIKRD